MSHPAEEGPIPLAISPTRARESPPPPSPTTTTGHNASYAEAASSFKSPTNATDVTRSRRDPQPPFYSSSPTRVSVIKSSPNPRRRCSQADRGSMPISASLLSNDIFPDSEEEREADDVYNSETTPHTMMTPLLDVRQDGGYQNNSQHRSNEPPCYQDVLLEEEDLHISIIGYHFHRYRLYIYYILCLATGGMLYLLGRWMPRLWVAWVGKACAMGNAEWVVVENGWGEASIEKVNRNFYGGTLKSVFGSYDEEEGDQMERDSILEKLHFFDYRYIRFIYHPVEKVFVLNSTWKDSSWRSIAECRAGVSEETQQERMLLFGPNVIDIREKSIAQLLVQEVLHPFYIFQVFSMMLWFLDEYIYYAACIFIISSSSIISTLVDTRRNMRKMRDMSRFICDVVVFRNEKWKFIRSNELVPGDVIDISSRSLQIHPCDAILLEGDAIVNESMLTGESVPVSKVPANDKTLRSIDLSALNIPADLAKHVLFAGTKSIRVRVAAPAESSQIIGTSPGSRRNVDANGNGTRALAMVIRTGFNTTKGALVRSMMFPRPNKFQFYRDSFRFIGVLSVLAFIGFLASLYNFIRMGVGLHLIIVRALDLITIVVPPALPATMSIGTGFAIARLRKANIYCISPPRVNICGKLNVICFDKTGTLTEEGLDVLGVRYTQMETGRLSPLYRHASEIPDDYNDTTDEQTRSLLPSPFGYSLPPILHIMTTCHSLKHVNGELIGDPLDFKMFEFTHWVLEEGGIPLNVQPNNSNESINDSSPGMRNEPTPLTRGMVPAIVRPAGTKPSSFEYALTDGLCLNGGLRPPMELGIIRVFEFISQLRRMAVIVRRLRGSNMEVFVKGAPEVMRDICVPDSFPADYEETLLHYTQHGYRVIACAAKPLYDVSWMAAQKMKREQVEFDLRFVGFVIFENKLKPGTTPVIQTLRTANIRQVMCTGDNILTAISVSRECGLVSAQSQVFVPRFAEGSPMDAQSKIVWEPSDGTGEKLNPETLMPDSISGQRNGTAHPYPILGPRDYDLAVNGDAFRWMVDYGPIETLNKMLVKTAIFARMSPDEKHELVEKLHALGYVVGFCGDGANDCGALKAADVGVSLSEAEASVAAPFTSRSTDVSCVVQTIREGRAALVTSFSCFKYMALYSLIQFTTVTFLYIFASNLGDFQFLYIDLFLIIPIAIFMGHTEPHEKIHAKGPTASLVSKRVLSSLFGHVFLQGFFQWLVYTLVRKQPWYTAPVIDPNEKNISCYENTSLFLFSCFQYVLIAVIFSVGPPYRKKMTSNVPYIVATFLLLLLTTYLVVAPSAWVMSTLELRPLPSSWKGFILCAVVVYFTFAWFGEHFVFPGIVRWYLKVRRRNRREVKMEHKKRFKRIEMQLQLR